MGNPIVEALMAQKLIETMSQEQKDKLVAEYIQTNVFGMLFDSMVKDPARKVLADLINIEIQKQMREVINNHLIEAIVSEVIKEELADKSKIKKWLQERIIKKAARQILWE